MSKNALRLWLVTLLLSGAGFGQTAQEPAGAAVKPVGTVKAVAGKAVTVTTDAGGTTTVVIGEATRMLRTAPGQKDLKGATPATLQDVQVGDRIMARGRQAADGSVDAGVVLVMKASDLATKQQQDRDDWQKRGIGGLVTAIDAGAGNITVSISTFAGTKSATVHVARDTVVRRYAPDSVKFDDARPGALAEIKVGDQLRARGVKNADGSELNAEEIVSGTFRNVAGTVISTDVSKQEVSVMDAATQRPMVLRVGADSQMRELPAMMAQRIAMRLKGGAGSDQAGGQAQKPAEGAASGPPQRAAGRADFQQLLSRLPAVAIGDLQKGSAVMIVATQGSDTNPPTAITLLTGVEAILTASPKGGQAAMLLSPWNLGGAGADAAGNP